MGAYRLEDFDSETRERSSLETLKADMLERERNDAYARGFKDGVTVTRDAVETETNKLLSAIASVAADLKVGHDEACQTVLTSTGPLIDAVIRMLSPKLAETAFPQLLLENVVAACRNSVGGQVAVVVPTGQAALLDNIGEAMDVTLGITESPELEANTARISWAGGTDRIDMNLMLSTIEAELDRFLEEIAQQKQGGDGHV